LRHARIFLELPIGTGDRPSKLGKLTKFLVQNGLFLLNFTELPLDIWIIGASSLTRLVLFMGSHLFGPF
jgi:hypothetical protein